MEHLISVIIPAYNIEQYIGRCLESVCQQTYKILEIIVVNDGSTDRTGEIVNQYSKMDSRIKVIHKKNGGVSTARLTGLEKATGDYIGFVDGDDYIEPEMYSKLLENALKYGAQISHCGNKVIFSDGREEIHYGTGQLIIQSRQEALKELLKGELVEPGLSNKIFQREIVLNYQNISIWDTKIKINEDLLMNYILFKRAEKVVFEDIPFYHYILRKNSATTSKKQKYHFSDPIKVICLIKEDCVQNKELYEIVYERYLRTLINMAMQEVWTEDAHVAKRKIKEEVQNRNVFEFCNSKKMILMTLGVGWLNPIYKVIRKIYDMITGINKKYEVN